MKTTREQLLEKIEERFEKEFNNRSDKFWNDLCLHIRIFYRKVIERLLEKERPMGVSQWRAMGKKYGYWEYFKRKKNKRIWKKVVKIMIFLAISEYSGADPSDNLMEEQKQFYFRLIKENLPIPKLKEKK